MSSISDKHHGKKPDSERVAFLRALPLEVKQQLTGRETEDFMYGDEPSPSLLAKLKDYLVDDQS